MTTLGGAVLAVILESDLVGDQIFRDIAPNETPPPYVVFTDFVSDVPELKGNSAVLYRKQEVQVDLYQATEPSLTTGATIESDTLLADLIELAGAFLRRRLPRSVGDRVDISSVDDGSGAESAQNCSSLDWNGSIAVAQADPWVSGWSDTRWITYLAHANGFSSEVGENPGGNTAADLPAIFSLVQSCGLSALQWAWDDNLYDGGSNATLAEYVAAS
jgi:hypothetical protein